MTDGLNEWRQAAYKATRERDEARAERDRFRLAWHNARDRARHARELTAHYVDLVDLAQRQVGDLAEAIRQGWTRDRLRAFMTGKIPAPLRAAPPVPDCVAAGHGHRHPVYRLPGDLVRWGPCDYCGKPYRETVLL